MRIKLTDKSRDICEKIKDLEARNANALVEEGLTTEEVEQVQRTLKRLERVWGDYIHYGPS